MTWDALVFFLADVGWYSQTPDYKGQSLPPIHIGVKYRLALLGPALVMPLW